MAGPFCDGYKRIVAIDLYDLDDSAYRDYSRSRLARARSRKTNSWRAPVDIFVALVLLMVVAMIVLHEQGIL
jgi:type VI protein secretion system component VasF